MNNEELTNKYQLTCPVCGGQNISIQVMQENSGFTTVTKSSGSIKQKGHGCLWWILIGWWWWIVDLFLWIFAFPFRAIAALTKKKKYKTKNRSVTVQSNDVGYRQICTCQICGNVWTRTL